jgi:hypothetical protein
MRKWILGAVVVLGAVLAYSAGPFLGLLGLADAIQSRDAAAIIARVDVDTVRRSLVIQLLGEQSSISLDRFIEEDANPAMRDLAKGLAADALQAALDRASAKVLTPEVIVGLISEGRVGGGEAGEGTGFAFPDRPLGQLQGARFVSLNRFAFDLGQTSHPENWSRLVMRRRGVSWILHEIRLPQRVVMELRPVIKERIDQALRA